MTFLANRIRTNIRRLEGALIRVASYAHLTGKELTNDVVENLLREIPAGRRPTHYHHGSHPEKGG